MFALLAISRSRLEKPAMRPRTSNRIRWADKAIALNAKSTGALRMTRATLAEAPTAAKKT